MNNEEKILEMLAAMQGQMSAMQDRQEKTEEILVAMQGQMNAMQTEIKEMRAETSEKIDNLAEDLDEVRTSVNALVAWSERVSSIEELKIPKIM